MKLGELRVALESVANLTDVWNAIYTPVYRVLNINGGNTANAQVRVFDTSRVLYMDDVLGCRLMDIADLAGLDITLDREWELMGIPLELDDAD